MVGEMWKNMDMQVKNVYGGSGEKARKMGKPEKLTMHSQLSINENLGASHCGVLMCAIIDDILCIFDEKWS